MTLIPSKSMMVEDLMMFYELHGFCRVDLWNMDQVKLADLFASVFL